MDFNYPLEMVYKAALTALNEMPKGKLTGQDDVGGLLTVRWHGWTHWVQLRRLDAGTCSVTVTDHGSDQRDAHGILTAIHGQFSKIVTYPSEADYRSDFAQWHENGWEASAINSGKKGQVLVTYVLVPPKAETPKAEVVQLSADQILGEIRKLTELQEHGHITRAEAEAKKLELLARL